MLGNGIGQELGYEPFNSRRGNISLVALACRELFDLCSVHVINPFTRNIPVNPQLPAPVELTVTSKAVSVHRLTQGQEELRSRAEKRTERHTSVSYVKSWWFWKLPSGQGFPCMFWTFSELQLNGFCQGWRRKEHLLLPEKPWRPGTSAWQWYQARGAPAPQPWGHIVSLAAQQQPCSCPTYSCHKNPWDSRLWRSCRVRGCEWRCLAASNAAEQDWEAMGLSCNRPHVVLK